MCWKMYFVFFVIAVARCAVADFDSNIKNLMGEPDYRQVRLHWEVDSSKTTPGGFSIRYCELQTWGFQRCRVQQVPDFTENAVVDKEEDIKIFNTDIKGLRMATTYSFEVKAVKQEKGEREDRADGDDKNQNIIVIPTKGFSAKATQCLPHASEIEVSTGPFFGGRIAVEATDGERCAIDGEPDSPRDIYTLRINHTECGSQVNDTTVATFVLVQENLPILTHSTRRFLVLCSYQPETLTVRAGINLPNAANSHLHHGGRGQAHIEAPYDEVDNALGRRSRTGRVMQKPEALVKEEAAEYKEPRSYKNNFVPIFVITMLVIAGVIGIVALALKIAGKRITEEFDNVSIASELSTSSCSTVSDVETGCENKKQSDFSKNFK
ncbi:unnamed protein product [Psylliodes chrysocephalus]|uniref:ZP domain-containing protein n=1 Tax=Psylliodes chrysocephalus TaxID=3402493 RepID=A0A9P0CZI5_9CUCU|nr:unnamed protein product [Psylliodes chrysocephala]